MAASMGADTTPPPVEGHPFEAKGEWWSNCRHCGLAMAAHTSTITHPPEPPPRAVEGTLPGIDP